MIFRGLVTNTKKDSILTFILFNSSYANQFKIDPTLQNCAYLTFEKYKNYDGFEIFFFFSKRNSVNKLEDSGQLDENIKFIKEKLSKRNNPEIVLAWGYGKEKDYEERINLVLNILKGKDLKQITHKDDKSKMMHPGQLAWVKKGGFKNNAIITNFN